MLLHRPLPSVRRLARRLSLLVPLALLVASPPLRAGDAVSEAIDRGIEYLLGEAEANQLDPESKHKVGQLALETYALVVAGVPVYHPLIKKNFSTLHKQAVGTNHTYTVSCYLFALDAAISQIENDLLILQPREVRDQFRDNPRVGREYRPHLQKATQAIVRFQNDLGAWRYNANAKDFDNSNVQFAVLALGVGAKRRVPIDPEVWKGVVNHFLRTQQQSEKEVKGRLTMNRPGESRDDVQLVANDRGSRRSRRSGRDAERNGESGRTVVVGPENPETGVEDIQVFARGWPYAEDKNYRWNMTCAGLSSLLLARESLRGKIDPDMAKSLNTAIRDGYGWLMSSWTPTKSYYGVYSLEKVADIGEVRLFDGKDWYAEISSFLVENQSDDGGWPGGKSHGENPRVATSFALLVLNRATSLLTMSPASRIMISGRGSGLDAQNDRSWVYVPDLDTTMHFPSLLRVIRLRPSLKLIKFLENIVDNYPVEWKGELIPELAKVKDGIRNRSARKVVEDYLESITGCDYDDPEKYMAWFRRWQRVRLIGVAQKREHIPDLIGYYKKTNKSLALKKTIIWALIQCKAREALPLFLDDLMHEDAEIRLAAYNGFKSFFIDYPPTFDASASARVRGEQVAKIRDWYGKQRRS